MKKLEKDEKEILMTLSQKGALTPLEISVEHLMMPKDVMKKINILLEHGLIIRKGSGSGNEIIALNEKGKQTLSKGDLEI